MSTAAVAYRPPQWKNAALVSITVPAQHSTSSNGSGVFSATDVGQTTYVFDAVMDLGHTQRLTKTNHPVQTGADISSHAYLMPAQLVMDVGMSDAMAAYATGASSTQSSLNYTPFSGGVTKSVSAYQQMLTLQKSRSPLTVTTRLRTYTNMIVMSVSPRETNKTIGGLRMIVEFEQILLSAVSVNPVSARNQDTQNTGLGQVNAQSPNQSTLQQFLIQSRTDLNPPFTVPGAGGVSSSNVNNLGQLPGVTP